MNKFEYCTFDISLRDTLPKEAMESVTEEDWQSFESEYTVKEYVAEEILEKHYEDWEIFDEGDGVYIAIRVKGEKTYEIYEASIYYTLNVLSKRIFQSDAGTKTD